MKTTIESYQNQSQKQSKSQLTKRIDRLNLIQNYSFRLAKRDKLSFDGFKRSMKRIEALIIPLHDLRMVPETEINTLNEITPVTPQNIDEKIEDLKITNFYKIVSSKSSFQEAYDFVKNNYTKQELLLIDNSIPDYEGYNWTKEEGIKHLICSIKFNIAS